MWLSVIVVCSSLMVVFFQAVEVSAAEEIPLIDISKLRLASEASFCEETKDISQQIDHACRTIGFFYIQNHGVSEDLQNQLVDVSKSFFNFPAEIKYDIAMSKSGKAWRGYFGVGDEVTSGIPDQKEGIYFGTEIVEEDSRPLHGMNQWPGGPMGEVMKDSVLTYMNEMKLLGKLLMKAISCSLEVKDAHFLNQFEHPTELFRIFNYPPHNPEVFSSQSMGVGEHTDYGYLTILRQDASGGLQVRSLTNHSTWISAPPIENTFVINLGDALEHNTQGLYRATPHRVLQRINANTGRISMPYFFDPSFDASMIPMFSKPQGSEGVDRQATRWDKMDPTLFHGTYGQYLLKKVSKAFPALFEQYVQVLSSSEDQQEEL